MSHDFVEAALLRRAGWEVWMAPDIGGSFEEPPPTLLDYLIRDRRWCQGNLQHLRIVFAQGLTLPSRLHLAMGIMSYVVFAALAAASVRLGRRDDELQAPPAATYVGAPAVAAALCLPCRRAGHIGAGHPGAAVWAQAAGGRRGAGRRRAHPRPWRHPRADDRAVLGIAVLDPDGADRDAAAQLVCVLHPDGHGHRLESPDPHRPRLAARSGGAEIRGPYHHRRGQPPFCSGVMPPTGSTGLCRFWPD